LFLFGFLFADSLIYLYSLIWGCIEGWVSSWLDGQREKGVTGLEVKKKSHKYFVYESRTYWDKALHKKRKTSKYLGRLDREHGLVPSGEVNARITVLEYGNAVLAFHALEDLVPLLRGAFPDVWEELVALGIVRMTGMVPLKSVQHEWALLHDNGLTPSLDPRSLSRVLRRVGLDRAAQDTVFKGIGTGRELVYDLSCVYSKSEGVLFAEKGYNKDRCRLPQLNMALFCNVADGMPSMIRVLPGSVRDIKSLYTTLEEIGLEGKILILDRGFFSEGLATHLGEKKIGYLLPAKRNSKLYQEEIPLKAHFKYHDRLILAGHKELEHYHLYLFEDQDMMLEERKHLYELVDKSKLTMEEALGDSKTAGRILILSNQDRSEKEVYELYKKRDGVEKLFNYYKNMLDADRMYLQDDPSVFGHVFTAFVSLYGYCKLQGMLRKAELGHKYTPHDLLTIFKKVHEVTLNDKTITTEIPKNIEELQTKLKYHIHPQKMQS